MPDSLRTQRSIDIEAVVRAVFQASDDAIGLGHTAEEHIERTIARLTADRENAATLVEAFPETAGPTFTR